MPRLSTQTSAVREDLGSQLRRVRRDHDWTQAQLACALGLRQQQLSAIERGRPPSRALIDRVARLLGVPAHDLLRPATDGPTVDGALDALPVTSAP